MAETDRSEPEWIGEVLDFWFKDLSRADWYRKSKGLDETVRARFQGLHDRIARCHPDPADAPARTLLAAVIVLDQFPRNMFRDTARAFAADPLALALAKAAVSRGVDWGLSFDQRHCLYLPFQHSEDLADQARACDLYEALGDTEGLDFARRHKAVIERFGRFPHRNAALGRASTPEETVFLKQPGSAF
ncbi:MAG: DUF924 domain-containing protein [Alphaproteobacteria bacterium]|nr:DUF924 domain-containing protein [Alphaproteobacteria bacterium]